MRGIDRLGEMVAVNQMLRAFPGSEVEGVDNPQPPPHPVDSRTGASRPLALAAARGLVKRQVRQCTACELVSEDRFGPTPLREEDNGSRYPGADTRAVIYTDTPIRDGSRSHKLLSSMVNRAEIRPIWISSVCCSPQRVRLPSAASQLACRSNFTRQLQVSSCEWVFVFGATALRTLRQDKRLAEIYGTVFGYTVGGFEFKCSVLPHVDTLAADKAYREMAQRWLDDGLWRSDPPITDTIDGSVTPDGGKKTSQKKPRKNRWTPGKGQEGFAI